MKKLFFILMLAAAGAMSAGAAAPFAADSVPAAPYDWFEDPATGKFGFKFNGREVIPAKFDEVDSFNEGLATVKINGKWGFIDPSGKLVIPARYDNVWYFREGLAAVEING